MKKVFYILISVLAVAACSSKEDKANKLIKDYMFKHLHDFKSYEVVETKVDTLYNTPLWDSECIAYATIANEHLKKAEEYKSEAESDHRSMDIWSDGWSYTSRNEYNKAYKSWLNNKMDETTEKITYLTAAKKLREKLDSLDGKEQIGWLVNHTFRSNTLGGNSSLGHYIFLMDKNFKEITANYDTDDDELTDTMEAIGIVRDVIKTPEYADTLITGWFGLMDKYKEALDKL